MKIFPPLSEILWPPGYSTWRIVARYRYLLFGLVGFAAVVVAWPFIQAPSSPPLSSPAQVATAPVRVDGAKCSALLLKRKNATILQKPCGRSFQMAAGASIINNRALERGPQPSRNGTLTAADRAIVSPRQALRSTLWDQANSPDNIPSLALSPQAN